MGSNVAITWFRQDLRLLDNPALTAALEEAPHIVPLYVLADGQGGSTLGGAAKWWLQGSLHALSEALHEKGATLCLRHGDAAAEVAALAEQCDAASVHVNTCPEPHWREADAALEAILRKSGRRLVSHWGLRLFQPDDVRTKTGGIYGMYTPFANTVRRLRPPRAPLPVPQAIPGPPRAPRSDKLAQWNLLPRKPDWAEGLRATWSPGEATARARGRTFLQGAVRGYDTGRNLPGQDLTSRLSPHLHWGEISANSLWHALYRKPPGQAETIYANELIWRDFGAYLLWHRPQMPDAPLRPEFEKLPWRQDKPGLAAWQQGRTGVPIVDAGMRQLWQTGWMHNRVRMIAASFLVKHLLVDWRQGAAWFMDTLVDADLASNSANWQWVAGTGIDSQPFFRVFNPVSQGQKFDADGAYVRQYVPEIAALPNACLHAPWTAPEPVLRAARVRLGETYPKPLVDLAFGRQRALETYKRTVRGAAADDGHGARSGDDQGAGAGDIQAA
jgi:deoxyribodipyrimidine photo-lyase